MALPLTFNNTVYGAGFVGSDDGSPSGNFGFDDYSAGNITANGTVRAVGDSITLTGVLPGGSATQTVTVYATQFDNSSSVQFSSINPATGTSAGPNTRYVLSNTSLTSTPRFVSDGDTNLNSYSVAPVCFVSGTRILTTRGEIAVENLAVGDLAVTASGAERPIRWIGQRTIDCRGHAEPLSVMPVRVAAGAFGEGRPSRDLSVSPGHLLCLDVLGEVLVPAAVLVNGATITQETVETVSYWHVELDSHDILLAEGQPAESYLDVGNRGFFAGSAVVSLGARPDMPVAGHDGFCRPVHGDGVLIDAVRSRLQERAQLLGWRLDDAPLAGLHCLVDGARIEPEAEGLVATFAIPAAAQDVWLVSQTCVPRHVLLNEDSRRLGLCLAGLAIDDGEIALDDGRLNEGLHEMQPGHRWTAGRTRLPAALFADSHDGAVLRIALAAPALVRWVAPEAGASDARATCEAVAA